MDNNKEELRRQLIKCRNILDKGYTNIQNTKLGWLNTFCLEFLEFSQTLHIFLSQLPEKQKSDKNDDMEIIYLCLTQIVTCIKYMENTIKAEEHHGGAISASRQHFLDRIHWCLQRLRTHLKSLTVQENQNPKISEENSFVELMDKALDLLSSYSTYKDEESQTNLQQRKCINVAESKAEALFSSQEIRSLIDLVLGHTLAFANVALKQDKKALSALCQKVLRECIAFQEECSSCMLPGVVFNDSNRKVKAISLENALYQLEDYINEALLRLIYTCFLDFTKFSIDKLRQVIKERGTDDPELDELIADFDVNLDRTTQIGIFAIAFAPNMKVKTILRSCLASFESLDSCIIPALQTKGTADVFGKILEQHFNEEVSIFKKTIQEIIDTQAFASSYFEILTQTINQNGKEYNKNSLEDVIKMGEFLNEHFHLPVNQKQLHINKGTDRIELCTKFSLILKECQAVLKCDTLQLEPQRVLKRFKILRSILRKLTDDFGDKTTNTISNNSLVFLTPENLNDSEEMFSSIGISPSIPSILYAPQHTKRNQRLLNYSLKGNSSKLPMTPDTKSQSILNSNTIPGKNLPAAQTQRTSLRRRESLRTALFKRQKTQETEKIYSVYKNESDSLQITEILNQLSCLSSDLSQHSLNTGIISA